MKTQIDDQPWDKYQAKHKPAFEGPIPVKTVFKLYRIPIFRKLCESLGYEFIGPVNESINLLCKNFDILKITYYLSLEYKTIIPPSRHQPLINHLIKIGAVL